MNDEPGVSGDGLELYKVHDHTNILLDTTGWHLRHYEHLSLLLHCLCHFCYHEGWYFVFWLLILASGLCFLGSAFRYLGNFKLWSSGFLMNLTNGHDKTIAISDWWKSRPLMFTHFILPQYRRVSIIITFIKQVVLGFGEVHSKYCTVPRCSDYF